MTTRKKCSTPDCDRDSFAQGYCLMHYRRMRRQGTIQKLPTTSTCTLPDCDNPHLAKGYCRLHYKRFIAYGDPYKTKLLKYGGSESHSLYSTWLNMRQRCYNPNSHEFNSYGARGIRICDRWYLSNGFSNFVEDMGGKPTPKHSIDRIDNDADYSPSNCRWATRHEQMRNTQRVTTTPGVRRENNKFLAQIKIDKKSIRIGLYDTLEEAIQARKQAEIGL